MSDTDFRLTDEQVASFHENGFVVVPDVFTPEECQRYIDHHLALKNGEIELPGWTPRNPDNWGRTHNTHFYDPVALEWSCCCIRVWHSPSASALATSRGAFRPCTSTSAPPRAVIRIATS